MKRHLLLTVLLLCIAPAPSFAQAQEDDEPTTQSDRDPNEVRRGVEMGMSREERARVFYERVISKVEPSLHGDVNNMPQYLELFTREFVEDPRAFAIKLHYGITGDAKASVDGYVEFPEHKEAMKEFFKHLKLPDVEDQTELLPSKELGDRGFAVITSPRAFIYDKPGSPPGGSEVKRERLTEAMQGETIYLLKNMADHFLCHSPSGYVGFIAIKDVKPINEKALIEIESAIPVQRGAQIETMIAAASKLKGTKYVWGGSSAEGIDCSGLVYSSFKSIGIAMPRDADQQFVVGRLVGTRWHRSLLRRGDLLYFLGRRGTISHTAIYLGQNKFLEATSDPKPGMVKITSFEPTDKDYSEKRDKSFCFAKRVIE